jgi:outer membrane protein assembly factor BamA
MEAEPTLQPVGPPVPTDARLVRNYPVHVEGLKIVGNDKTRAEYFDNEFRDALAAPDMKSLAARLDQAAERLRATGVFKSADVNIEVAEGGRNGKIAATVSVQVKEKLTPYLQVSYCLVTLLWHC